MCSLLLMAACKAGPSSSAWEDSKVAFPPEAQLSLVKIAKVNPSLGEGFNYGLKAMGLPPDRSYRLEVRRLDGRVGQMPIGRLHVDATGRLVSERGFRLEQHVLGTGPVLRGEPLEPALVAEDGSGQVVTRIVPAPIEAAGAEGCRLSIELVESTGKVFRVKGEGFAPEEEVQTTSRSEGEVLQGRVRASKAGRIEIIVLPAVVGRTGGSASYVVSGQACSVLALPYHWGTAMERA
jgi:hypothetical protein